MSTTTSNATSSSAQAQAVWASLNGSKSKAAAAGGTSSGDTGVAGIQNQFLKLLTTQLQNQDPLNPMDNAQVTTQLAQISTVEGIQQLNASLQKMLGNTSDSQAMQAASLVGHAVLVPGSAIPMANGSAYAGFDLAGPADKVTVTIKDANGLVVRRLDLGAGNAGSNMFTWDGKTDSGAAAANGSYSFTVAAVQGANNVNATALSAGLVNSVVRSGSSFNLDVGTLGTFGFGEVREVL